MEGCSKKKKSLKADISYLRVRLCNTRVADIEISLCSVKAWRIISLLICFFICMHFLTLLHNWSLWMMNPWPIISLCSRCWICCSTEDKMRHELLVIHIHGLNSPPGLKLVCMYVSLCVHAGALTVTMAGKVSVDGKHGLCLVFSLIEIILHTTDLLFRSNCSVLLCVEQWGIEKKNCVMSGTWTGNSAL